MPRKPCSTNCATVPAWSATRSDLTPSGSIGNFADALDREAKSLDHFDFTDSFGRMPHKN